MPQGLIRNRKIPMSISKIYFHNLCDRNSKGSDHQACLSFVCSPLDVKVIVRIYCTLFILTLSRILSSALSSA